MQHTRAWTRKTGRAATNTATRPARRCRTTHKPAHEHTSHQRISKPGPASFSPAFHGSHDPSPSYSARRGPGSGVGPEAWGRSWSVAQPSGSGEPSVDGPDYGLPCSAVLEGIRLLPGLLPGFRVGLDKFLADLLGGDLAVALGPDLDHRPPHGRHRP